MDNISNVEKLQEIILGSDNIVFFGGAGVSTESGIPDFRSSGGLYSEKFGQVSPEEILSHDFLFHQPSAFYEFYRTKMLYPDAEPNAAHYALAKLEQMGKLKAVITQNIDGLHSKAGSKNVIELHGTVLKNYCTRCRKTFGFDYILKTAGVPKCPECGGFVRPDVVMYGESLDNDALNAAVMAIGKADTLIVGGTSLTVYPAAGLIRYFKGRELVLINRDETGYDSSATLVIRESIGSVFEKIANWYCK